MSLLSLAIGAIEKRVPKVIDARTHGAIDYGHAGFFLGMALLCRKRNPRAATAALFTSSLVLVQSLLTDYPLGVEPVLSFEAHGKMDGGFAGISALIPTVFGFEGTPAATVFKANAFIEGAIVSMTDFDSQRAHTARCGASIGNAASFAE